MTQLAPILQAFFTTRLVSQYAASPHTIAAYRDSWRLLLQYAAQTTGTAPSGLDLSQLGPDLGSASGGEHERLGCGGFGCEVPKDRNGCAVKGCDAVLATLAVAEDVLSATQQHRHNQDLGINGVMPTSA